jgi:hypothetical protein
MSIRELTALLNIATTQGTTNALSVSLTLKDSYSKARSYQLYGRSNVDRWISEGLIKVSDKKIDRFKLEAIAAASNRRTYLPVADR